MDVAATQRASSVHLGSAAAASPAPVPSNRGLLPAPKPEGMTPVAMDDMSGLFQMMADQRDVGASNEKVQINGDKQKRDMEMRKMFEAKRKEAAARSGRGLMGSLGKLVGDVAKNLVTLKPGRVFTGTAQNFKDMGASPKFWSDLTAGAALVAKVASAVIAAATVITGPGAAGGVAFAAAIISLVCMAEGELKILERCGVKGAAANGIRLGASAVTIAMGNGQALSNAASTASKGAQVGAKGAEAAAKTVSTAQKAIKITTETAKVLEPTAKSVQAGSDMAGAVHTRNIENHRADGEEHGFAKDAANRDLELHVQSSIEGMESLEKLLGLVQQTMAARSQTTLSLTAAIGGRA